MKQIGVGLIGYGLGGRAFHAPYVAVTPGLALRAIVSRDREKVRAYWPSVDVVPNVGALLALSDIDLVIVCSPDALHAEHAEMAIAAGKHVLVDKPFATNLADARRIAAMAEASNKLLTIFHNRRWDADFLTVQRLIADDMLGDIVQFESCFNRWRPEPAAVWKEAREGGSWFDLGPHLVDQALQLFEHPLGITGDLASLRKGSPAPDYFHMVLRYPDRRVILHSNKMVADHGLRFTVHGSRASWVKHGIDPQEAVVLAGRAPQGDDWGHDPTPGMLTRGDAPTMAGPVPNEKGNYRQFWDALVTAIAGDGPNPVPASEAIAVMEILDAGLRSAAMRREISF